MKRMINSTYIFPLISDYDLSLPLCVVTVGSDTIVHTGKNKIKTIRPNGIVHHQFLFTTEGRASVVFGGSSHVASPGTLTYHAPNTPHHYECISDSWTSYWLTFSTAGNPILEIKNGIYPLRDIAPFINIITQMINLKNDFNFGEKSSILLYEMMLGLKRCFSENIPNDAYPLLKSSVEYLHQNFAAEIDLNTLAETAGVTPGYYCKIFKECYHMRPFEYLQKLRIQKAKSLLFSHPNTPVAEVGETVGYMSPSYFIKQFKKQEHVTPSEFRRRHCTFI